MDKTKFTNEKLYQTTMSFVRKMLENGTISREQYTVIDTIFIEKYRPILGKLFSENDLIY